MVTRYIIRVDWCKNDGDWEMATGGEIPIPTQMSIVRTASGIVKVVFCTYTLVSGVFAFLSAILLVLIPRQTDFSIQTKCTKIPWVIMAGITALHSIAQPK